MSACCFKSMVSHRSLPGIGIAVTDLADQLVPGVDLVADLARHAAELFLHGRFDAGFPDAVVLVVGLGWILMLLDEAPLLVAQRSDVAEDVGEQGTVRIVAHRAAGRDHSWELAAVLGEEDRNLLGHVLSDGNRSKAAEPQVVEPVDQVLDAHRLERIRPRELDREAIEQLAAIVRRQLDVALPVDGDAERQAVVDDHLAIAIEDPSAAVQARI